MANWRKAASLLRKGMDAARSLHSPVETQIQLWQIAPILESVASDVDVDSLLSNLGFPDGLGNLAPDTELPLHTYFRIQREIARSLNDLTLHLSSRKLIYQTGDFVLEQMKRARTLREAVDCLCEYFNMMHGDTYNAAYLRGDTLALIIDDTHFPYTLKDDETFTRFVGDCVLIKVHCLLDSLTHGVAMQALRRVCVRRSREDPGGNQNAFWTVPVTYGRPVYELIYDFDLACEPIQSPNIEDLSTDSMFARIISHIELLEQSRDDRSMTVRARELIEDGCIFQDTVAVRLGMSVATLRRRLSEEETSFRTLVHQVRFEEAKAMLERGKSVNQVSEQLDYSDIRAFNRAFKKWAGQTPAAFAKMVRASEV